jgi:FMN hydrolase / 5-amino-6-(5-phospho-D-ribitylamino)uracil phosphatase
MTIRLLTFDLDDTLWEFAPVLVRAEAIVYAWLQEHVPAVTEKFSCDALRDMRLQIARDNPDLAHRVTDLRVRGLHRAMEQAGVSNLYIEALVEQAFAIFLHARHDIELFDDAEQVLLELKKQFQLGAITNGNFDIARAGLDRFFDFGVSAEKLARAKPHPEPFLHALSLAACAPHECIHIGDDSENDVRGAQRLGIHTIWINRQKLPWKGDGHPSQEVQRLVDLPAAVQRIIDSIR